MFRRAICLAPILALVAATPVWGQATSLTLQEALSRALASHPDLRSAEATVAVARSELTTARALSPNPFVTASFGPARSSDTTLTNFQIGLAQALELGGKRANRRRAAELRVDAALARRERQRALVAWRVQRAFYLALVGRERAATALEADSVGLALRDAAQERLTLGAGTQLELNVATAAHARDRRIRFDAERQLASALFDFRAALGTFASDSVLPRGALPRYGDAALRVDSLVAVAVARRPDLRAVRAERDAAEANLRYARALLWPDPEIGVSTGREEDFRVTQFSISLPFPLWNRSQGARGTAAAALDLARIAEDSAQRAIELEVRDAHQAFTRALASREAFDAQVIERLAENLSLADESFRAGKISLFAYNTIRRDLVEARLAYLDAIAETIQRRYALALAIGEPWE